MSEIQVSLVIQRLQSLRREGIFKHWTLDDLELVAAHCPVVEFNEADTLFHRGEVALWFGCILDGRCAASIDETDLKLGQKRQGDWIGTSRALVVPNNHLRPYTLRAVGSGFLLWVTYRTYWSFGKTNPRLYYVLSHSLHTAQLEYAANLFTGQPFSVKWKTGELTVRRVLDALTRFRNRKLLFLDCDDATLLGLAARMRTVSFLAAECLQSRMSPCFECHVVLSGRVAIFDDPAKGPSSRLSAGTVFGVNAISAPYTVCPYDVFASAPTCVALITAENVRCLGVENPVGAAHVISALVDANVHSAPFPAATLLSEAYELAPRPPGDVTGLHEYNRLQNAAQVSRLTEHIEMREGKGFLGDFCSKKQSDGLLSPARRSRSFSPHRNRASVTSASTKCSSARASSGIPSAKSGSRLFPDAKTTFAEDVRRARLASSVSPSKWSEDVHKKALPPKPSWWTPQSRERIEKLIKRPLTASEVRRVNEHSPALLGGKDENVVETQNFLSDSRSVFREDYRKGLLNRLKKWTGGEHVDDEAWNLMAVKYDEEAQFLWHELDMLSQENRRLTLCLSETTKERDAWKQKCLKGKLNYEFEDSLADWRAANEEPKVVGGRLVYH